MLKLYSILALVIVASGSVMMCACFRATGQQEPFAIAWSYDTSGFLETCGCSTNQLGGLTRRATRLAALREDQPVLALEGAHFIEDAGEYQRFKGEIIIRALRAMDYNALILGVREAQQGAEALEQYSALAQFPCICANLIVDGASWDVPSALITIGGTKVAIIAVSQPEFASFTLPDGISFTDPAAALQTALAGAKGADLRVVCLEGGAGWISEMLEQFNSQADLFLTGDRKEATATYEFSADPPRLNNYKYGKYLGVVFVNPTDAGFSLSGVNLPIEDSLAEDPAIVQLLEQDYRAQLKDRFFSQLKVDLAQLYLPPDACEPCHREAYAVYQRTAHSRALDTLLAKGQLFNPDCMPCHVVYDPQQDKLEAMNCVVCHSDITEQHLWDAANGDVQPATVQVTAYAYEWCVQCHTAEQSHRFAGHWPQMVRQIYHGGDLSQAEQGAAELGLDINAEPPPH